ncbi:MAG: site-specific DNA-methyltransferase [Kiritimatiellae bacterium]|nr:site-specific DNA-methyltransferase [Kiritimatiellia bacterium]
MATLNDLVGQIENAALRERIEEEIKRVVKQKKFGLVFEEHLPECTPLWEIPVKRGSLVAKKDGKMDDVWRVAKIKDGKAICVRDVTAGETNAVEFELSDLVTVARFGEPIYPFLKPLGSVTNAPDNDLWHTLIEADNYHALQFLEYIYGGKVDCIYIDPPYNTGAKDWKYNNNYVDDNDAYRHSKWLSMMQKRLALAKKLLNPCDSVLIVTIDEKEYLHLGCLLEEMFPEARIQMVSSVINPAGAGRQTEFARTDEYVYFVQMGSSSVLPESRTTTQVPIIWDSLRRSSLANARGVHGKGACGPNQFYPIYVDDTTGRIVKIGDPIPENVNRDSAPVIPGCTAVFPIRPNGKEMNWGIKPEEARVRLKNGFLRAGKHTPNEPQKYVISYVTGGNIKDISTGKAVMAGYDKDGCVIAYYPTGRDKMPTTNWNRPSHDAQQYGTKIINPLLEGRFPYPKSLYAVYDCLRFVIANKPNATVVDFFAGSGTTLHAVNLLNAEDGGNRQCVMVTNNEVSDAEAKSLTEQGYKPGDEEWERLGIARYVTWPRTVCSIEGHDVKGQPLKGNYGVEIDDYIVDEEDTVVSKTTGKPTKAKIYKKTKRQMYPRLAEMAMADGFKANAAFFKLGFLDKTSVSLGRQFREMLPTLWMKAGVHGPCPKASGEVGDMLILPKNKFAVLLEESAFRAFQKELAQVDGIETVYIVTDYGQSYKSMASALKGKTTYQLYRDYLDNFRINKGRK